MIFKNFVDSILLTKSTEYLELLDAGELVVSSNQIPIETARQMVTVIAEKIPLSEVNPTALINDHTWDIGVRLGSRWLCMLDTNGSRDSLSPNDMQQEVDEIIRDVLAGEFDDAINETYPTVMIGQDNP